MFLFLIKDLREKNLHLWFSVSTISAGLSRSIIAAVMDNALDVHSSLTLGAWLLLQILTMSLTHYVPALTTEDKNSEDAFTEIIDGVGQPAEDPLAILSSYFLNLLFPTSLYLLPDDLGFWVKPQSTTWFSRFLMAEYDDRRWLEMFRMTKASVFALVDLLAPHVRRKDTKYRVAIPVVIRVAYTLFKLTHGASLFICLEMFAIGKSIVCSILRDVVHAVNDTLRHNIT